MSPQMRVRLASANANASITTHVPLVIDLLRPRFALRLSHGTGGRHGISAGVADAAALTHPRGV